MAEIKVGDRVLLKTGHGFCFIGEATVVACVTNNRCSPVVNRLHAESASGACCHCSTESWELISSAQNTMASLKKLTKQQEAGLSKEDKALLQVGYIGDDLEPTVAGKKANEEYMFAQNRKALAAQAEEEIAELVKQAKKLSA